MTNREAFAAAMAVLGATFDRKLSGPAIEGYWLALQVLTEAEFAVATKRAVTECRFMPAPAELLSLSGRVSVPARAGLAWEAVRKAMDRHDYTDSVDFGPLVNAVVRNLGGWYWLCDQTLTALPFVRKDFERVFAELEHHDPATLHGEALEGSLHGEVVRIAIEGEMPSERKPLRLESGIRDIIRELATAKAVK